MNSKKEIINLKPSNITIGNKLKKQTDKENTLNTIIHLFKLYLIPVVTDILSIPPPDHAKSSATLVSPVNVSLNSVC